MRIAAAALLSLLTMAAPALGQATTTATPNRAGKATRLHTELDATQPPLLGRIPKQTSLFLDGGFSFDGRAVAARCTAEQGSNNSCPAKSAIGKALVTATYGGMDLPVPISLYLAKPAPGDVAAFVAVAVVLGSPYSVTGRVVRTDTEELSVVLPSPGPDASSFGATLKSFSADLGAMRTVTKGRKGHRRKVKYSLLTNPMACTGTWSSRAQFTFADSTTATLESPIACIP